MNIVNLEKFIKCGEARLRSALSAVLSVGIGLATAAFLLDVAPTEVWADDLTWTREDFNITEDGKQIGYRKNIEVPAKDGQPAHTENIIIPGLNARGREKLKKNPHLVIPDGIEIIHEVAFTGHLQGNNEYIPGEPYIEELTLPQSLKVIEYGAFGWNKIRGTVVIPPKVISIHSGAFLSNEIEKVVFQGVLDGKGKLNPNDPDDYYLDGIGEKAFQANKIAEIVVKDNLGKYKFLCRKDDPSAAPFNNQELGIINIELGESYVRPIKVTQESGRHPVMTMEGFKEDGVVTPINNSKYFTRDNSGKLIATKTGQIEGQTMHYDLYNNEYRYVGTWHYAYNILPKSIVCTVTFVNGTNKDYVKVKKNKSISDRSVAGQAMPADPVRPGYVFKAWNTAADGAGTAFDAQSVVTGDMTVFAIFAPAPQPQPVPNPQQPEPNPQHPGGEPSQTHGTPFPPVILQQPGCDAAPKQAEVTKKTAKPSSARGETTVTPQDDLPKTGEAMTQLILPGVLILAGLSLVGVVLRRQTKHLKQEK